MVILLGTFEHTTAQDKRLFNRSQYHKYSWNVFHASLFHIFYPSGYDSLASFASVHLPDIMVEVKREMGVGFKEEFNIVIYPSPDQSYESNIGLYEKEVQTFPTINLKGNRVIVAFNGSWEKFRLQLKEAWVMLCWERQFKNDLEEQLTNRKQTIPSWFKKGCIHYFAYGWEVNDEDGLPQMFKYNPERFEALLQNDETLSGQAFCYFLSQQYREDAVKQIVFQMRQGKSLARAARLITKRRLDTLQVQCLDFYRQRFSINTDEKIVGADTLKPFLEKNYKGKLFDLSFNRDSNALYFVIASGSKRTIYVGSLRELRQSKKKLKSFLHYDMPPWLEDHSADPYPVVRWKEKGGGITLLLPMKRNMQMWQYNSKGQQTDSRILYGVDGVNTVHEWQCEYLLSAYRKGRSDIITYDPQRLRYHALTSDQADHTELSLSTQNDEIAYRSGYPADSLYHVDSVAKHYGIYTKSIQGDFKTVAKAQDHVSAKDSAYIKVNDPEYKNGALYFNSTASGAVKQVKANGNNTMPGTGQSTVSPWLSDYLARQKKKDSINHLVQKLKEQDVSVLKKILTPGDTKAAADMHEDSIRKAVAYTAKKVSPYILQLYSSYFSAQINNDYYINRYQPFQAYLGTFKFPEVGAMAQGGFSDLFGITRAQVGYSGGQSKILYNFGGLDNNIVPRVDTSVHFAQGAPYAFQTIVTPFRGYTQNSIYGSNYGLLNADVYFPLFRTLIPLQTSFGAVNNLQLGLFTDIAVAGRKENPVSTTSSLMAYGISARTMLASYPIRFDIAWPGSFSEKPVWYLSLVIK